MKKLCGAPALQKVIVNRIRPTLFSLPPLAFQDLSLNLTFQVLLFFPHISYIPAKFNFWAILLIPQDFDHAVPPPGMPFISSMYVRLLLAFLRYPRMSVSLVEIISLLNFQSILSGPVIKFTPFYLSNIIWKHDFNIPQRPESP